MRVAVIGAGIAGVATACELAQDGHAVTVIERHGSVAAEASFAPAGLLGVGAVAPWSADGPTGPFAGGRAFDPQVWRWRWQARQAAASPQRAARQRALIALARLSLERTQHLRARLQLDHEHAAGLLLLLRDAREQSRLQPALAHLRELGVAAHELDAAGCYAVEPGLNRDQPLIGGLHLPQDEVANCRQFAHLLRDAAERAGAEFRFGSVVRALEGEGPGCTLRIEQLALTTGFAGSQVVTPAQAGGPSRLARRARAAARYLDPVSDETFDAVVLAAGVASAEWFAALGLRLPLLPLHGYSVTAALRSPERGPRAAVTEIDGRYVIGRLGQRLRIAGGAEPGGPAQRQRPASIEALYQGLNDWFPGGAHLARPQLWKGARPALPDGLPRVGPSPRPGVWLNLGHGGCGWALACGSARLLADQLAGRTPVLDASMFAVARGAKG